MCTLYNSAFVNKSQKDCGINILPMPRLSFSTQILREISSLEKASYRLFSNCSVFGAGVSPSSPKAEPLWCANPSRSMICSPKSFR